MIALKKKVCAGNDKGFVVITQKGIDPISLDMLAKEGIVGRGLHSSTSQLNLSQFSHKTHPRHPLLPPECDPPSHRKRLRGLTFVHSSAQPEPVLTQIHPRHPLTPPSTS